MYVEFEEKTYESYFNSELDRRSSFYFPLGQVQEGIMGMDSTAYSRNRRLWRDLGYPYWIFPPFGGVDLKDVAQKMENFLRTTVMNIPPIKVNLLFQYKRPKYISSELGKEWTFWNQPYFRYEIYNKQHYLLEHLEQFLENRALVLYAAPAITKINDLVDLKNKRKIIENTNFKKVLELSGHHMNTYIKAGTFSQAFSEPEKIDNFNLLNFLEKQYKIKETSNLQFIIDFTESVISIFKESSRYEYAYESLINEYTEVRQFQLLFSMIQMKLFRDLTGIQWLINI